MDIDTALVARLIGSQFPQWSGLPIYPAEPNGWDNRTFRLGPDLLVRLPSAEGYAAQVRKEQRWLPLLAPRRAAADSGAGGEEDCPAQGLSGRTRWR